MSSSLPFYVNLPVERLQKAREVLCSQLNMPLDDTTADAVLETIWNALVGHEDEYGALLGNIRRR